MVGGKRDRDAMIVTTTTRTTTTPPTMMSEVVVAALDKLMYPSHLGRTPSPVAEANQRARIPFMEIVKSSK